MRCGPRMLVALLAALAAGCASAPGPAAAPTAASARMPPATPPMPTPAAPVVAPPPPAAALAPAPTPAAVAPLPTPAPPLPPVPAVLEPPSPLERGRALLARGEAGSALPALREALRLEPDRLEARASLAQALYAVGDLDAAVEEGRAVLRRDPDMAGARLPVAAALMARHDWAGARAELDEAVRRRPDLLQGHLSLGLVRYTQGDLDGAIASYRRVLDLEPGHADARLSLALTLKLARREGEAARELTAAAEAGLPRAQYFLGAAYAQGGGVPRDLVRAIAWWMRAGDGGVAQAEEALAQLRQVALGRTRYSSAERQAVEQAFRDYRAGLWSDFPELARSAAEDGVGAALLRRGRALDALPVLIHEAAALGEPAQRQLELLYERGVAGQLPPHDARVLAWVRAAAAEGQAGPRLALARIYAQGLGVPRDVGRAVTLLRSTPGEEAQRLLRELQR